MSRKTYQAAVLLIATGLILLALVAMILLSLNFGAGELVKTALGSTIVLSGVGLGIVVQALKTEEARAESRAARDEARLSRDAAAESIRQAAAELDADRHARAAATEAAARAPRRRSLRERLRRQ